MPDYFEGEFITGHVRQAAFSAEEGSPVLVVDYKAGSDLFQYKTTMWFLKKYRQGDEVTMIYNPSNPQTASIYAFIGYWIQWPELLFTAVFFVLLFVAAKFITGPSPGNNERLAAD